MSRKIIGVTVGTQLPKPNFKQDDPTKGDYIKNRPDFDGLSKKVNEVQSLVGDTSVAEQISIMAENNIADWDQTDETAFDYIKNKPSVATDEEILMLLSEQDFIAPIVDATNHIYLDNNENILIM